MCGVISILSQSSPIPEGAIERATAALRHRGPDGQRCWTDADRRVALGHARLSIIDLATGDQPIANEDETLRIVVNGEFYGYEAIQQELERGGHRLRTRSDSEIALHLYEDSGVRCLKRLRGEFALALWDSVNRILFAARDRFGIKPLFYALHEDTFYLASEVKALFAAGVPAQWDGESACNWGSLDRHPARTLFAGVFQVPPGHYILATEGGVRLEKYWDFDYPEAAKASAPRSDIEYLQEFTSALDEAVRLRLRADVPVGCYLSGGIDSCAVLGLAARHQRGALRAFTLTFDRPEYNEGEVAREMAAKAGADYSPVLIHPDDLADHFAEATAQSETLCVNAHGVAKYLLSRSVRDAGYKVVLTGEGADEVLGGYMHFRRDVAPRNGNGTAPDGSGANGLKARLQGSVRQQLGFLPGWVETALALSEKIHGVMADDYLKERTGDGCIFDSVDVANQLAGRDPLHQSLYLWAKTRLPNYILTLLGDRMEMAHSVEGRVPFLDHHLVELMRSQPVTQKIRGAAQKYVLRESVRDMVTEAVYRGHKHPFLSPPLTLQTNGRFYCLLQDMLRSPVLGSMPFFDQRKVVNLLDVLPAMDESSRLANDQVLMVALSACVLQERYRPSA